MDSRSTPARLTETATVKLSRPFLLLITAIYILAGLFFRDPWKTDDVVGLATMISALSDPSGKALLAPQIGVLAHAQEGPLTTWVGAFFIWVFAPVFDFFVPAHDGAIIASRLPNLLWFGILVGSVWYGSYLLGRRPEPQPLELPFGGEPSVNDYGRMIADAALLLILATVGIVWRMHETSEVPALIAFQALAFFAVARSMDRPLAGALTLGIALGAAFLTRGWIGSLPIILASIFAFHPHGALWSRRAWLLLSAAVALAIGLAWWIPVKMVAPFWAQNWWLWNSRSFGLPQPDVLLSLLRDLPWFLWPTWPFAILAIWRWRSWIAAPHIWVPLMFTAWPLIIMIFLADVFEPEYALMAVPAAVLAAFALPTLRRAVVNSLDWFAVMCFSLTAATVWLGWFALHTGMPEQIHHNITRLTRGYDIHVSWPSVLIALVGTLAWVGLVRWRLHNKPAALWRGTVLSAGGLITTWLLLVTLWMPVLDYVRSYRQVSGELAVALEQHARPRDCVRALGLGVGQRASFLVFNDITFSYDSQCVLILQQTTQKAVREGSVGFSDSAEVLWQGRRPADRDEMFRLLRVKRG
ncbi:MAG TPA: glycosyltransferase [Burkholderiaceae bacterium]|nr:glycosyltransferase [Burkholderiaceae bacterium]